jgi:hypothetical protein
MMRPASSLAPRASTRFRAQGLPESGSGLAWKPEVLGELDFGMVRLSPRSLERAKVLTLERVLRGDCS